ncbi:hypothetical protein [Mangrovibacillus cuniculi]|uniref:Uncharacterized protein n=1 Tax=Mangrovibacillus cuniculi TaxID=2593652 RepID=A0A7S8HFY7_9BACI|nr:hypothetical protein [Mangrovibacillus cuniculi]QPC47404.1 hypothetical protein G8O30_10815 [Mangrovibacillus cuniculi]
MMERWKSSIRGKWVLPNSPINVLFRSESKQLFITLGKEVVSEREYKGDADCVFQGTDHEISDVLSGNTLLSRSSLSFEGKYRQFLVIESFLWLTRL